MRQYPEITALEPTDGFWVDRIGTGSVWIEAGNIQSGVPYYAAFEFLSGTPPNNNEVMGGHVFPVAVNVAANAGFGFCVVNPTATFTANIYHVVAGVATSIGTMVIATSGAFTFTLTATAFAAGDSLKLVSTGLDATLADLWWTIPGVLA